ncbi:MAG: hypothetical protein ACXQS8_06200 [Candidatus Helarchaeales archaeon]
MQKKDNSSDSSNIFKMIEIVDKKKSEPLEETVLKLRTENKELASRLEEKTKMLKGIKIELRELEKTNKKQLKTIYDLIKFIDELKKERDSLKEKLSRHEPKKEEPSKLPRQEKIEDPKAVLQMIDMIDQKAKAVPSVENISGKLGNQIFELKKELKKVKTEKEKNEKILNEHVKKLQERLEELKNEKQKEVEMLTTENQQLKSRVEELESIKTKNEQNIQNLEEELKNNKAMIEYLKKEVKALKKEQVKIEKRII